MKKMGHFTTVLVVRDYKTKNIVGIRFLYFFQSNLAFFLLPNYSGNNIYPFPLLISTQASENIKI